MQDSLPTEIVIVRRRPDWEGDEPQHGVWKIAYADFMTAMMAFFLVMWLINVTDDSVKSGVAQYFNPVKLASTAPNKKGLNDPNVTGDTNEDGANLPEGDKNAGRGRKKGVDIKKGIAPNRVENSSEGTPGQFSPVFAESLLFNDPYAVLDKLAAMVVPTPEDGGVKKAEGLGAGEKRQAGAQGGEAFRDPFDPLYWQFLPTRGAGEADATADQKDNLKSKVAVYEERRPGDAETSKADAGKQPAFAKAGMLVKVSASAEKAKLATNTQIVAHVTGEKPQKKKAGAQSRVNAEVDKRYQQAGMLAVDQAKPAELKPNENTSKAEKLVARLSGALTENPTTSLGQTAARVDVSRTGEGVLISLTDDQKFGMFAIGSSEPRPELVTLLAKLGKVIAAEKGQIVIKGHTDARPFKNKAYDNWRLSSARAQMALYMLARGGVPMERFVRVEGYADRDLKLPKEPLAAANRRIEIYLKEEG